MSKKIIIGQIVFLIVAVGIVFMLYPRMSVSVNGNVVKVNSGNAKAIIISENPDFSGSRYIELKEQDIVYEKEDEDELVNIGNVKINVTKSKSGVMVGHIILEPEESEEIAGAENQEDIEYKGGEV